MRTRSMLMRVGVLVVLFALAATLASADPAGRKLDTAQVATGVGPLVGPNDAPVQYMVKFVCGFVPKHEPGTAPSPLKPGNYATAINIGNQTPDRHIIIKRVLLHYREGTPPPPVIKYQRAWLYPWRVLEIDCVDIWNLVQVAPETFVKGMVHIGTPLEFPVAAVYTAETSLDPALPPDAGAGISIDVEQYKPFFVSPD